MILSVNKIECHRINPNRVGSYIDSPDSTKKKKSKNTNRINKNDNKCFQYSATVALKHEETFSFL